jgi:amidophosphoribosyltransferase
MDDPSAGRYRLAAVNRPDDHVDTLVDEDDHFHDQCGVFGVFGSVEAAHLTYLGLHALQHRGQESAGIAVVDAGRLTMHRELGLVRDVFSANVLNRLTGDRAIGHVRYSTAGETHVKNAQPLAVDYALGGGRTQRQLHQLRRDPRGAREPRFDLSVHE